MSDEAPSGDGLRSVPPQESVTRRRVKVITLAAVGTVVMAVVALVWRPWVSASCVDDGSHVADEETGLCYTIPDGWERKEVGADQGEEGSAIVSVDGSGFVLATPLDDRSGGDDLDSTARTQAALLSGNGPGNESIRVESRTVDGHAGAVATYSDSEIWLMVTIVELDGRLIGLTSVCSVDAAEEIAQVEDVHRSLGVL